MNHTTIRHTSLSNWFFQKISPQKVHRAPTIPFAISTILTSGRHYSQSLFKKTPLDFAKPSSPYNQPEIDASVVNLLDVQSKISKGTLSDKDFLECELLLGELFFPDGKKFEEKFARGEAVAGKIVRRRNQEVLEGKFFQKRLTKGKVTFQTGEILEGKFVNGSLSKGAVFFPCGTIWKGEFVNGELTEGKSLSPDGSYAEGKFRNGSFVEGCLNLSTGAVFEGKFAQNRLLEGKVTLPNGEVHEGKFVNGKLTEGKISKPFFNLIKISK